MAQNDICFLHSMFQLAKIPLNLDTIVEGICYFPTDMSSEDLIIIFKSLTHKEHTPSKWCKPYSSIWQVMGHRMLNQMGLTLFQENHFHVPVSRGLSHPPKVYSVEQKYAKEKNTKRFSYLCANNYLSCIRVIQTEMFEPLALFDSWEPSAMLLLYVLFSTLYIIFIPQSF